MRRECCFREVVIAKTNKNLSKFLMRKFFKNLNISRKKSVIKGLMQEPKAENLSITHVAELKLLQKDLRKQQFNSVNLSYLIHIFHDS